jgi:hypothetical protein
VKIFTASILFFASAVCADDFKTVNGKEYKNATVSRVEPDGIVLKSKSGISKVYFVELPKEVKKRFGYNPESAADLMKQAEGALGNNQFAQAAELLNRIVSEYPASPQANTVRELRSGVRAKGASQDAPLTVSEAQKVRAAGDALAEIKRNYRTATPEKRRDLEAILGTETFRDTDAAAQNTNATARSRVEGLAPLSAELKNDMLNALNTTDKLDALYQRGCTSAEFIAAATPIEGVFVNLHKKLTRGEPRADLFANTFEAYQQTAVAMAAKERGRAGHPDESIQAAKARKTMLTDLLEDNMTPAEKDMYYTWLKATGR